MTWRSSFKPHSVSHELLLHIIDTGIDRPVNRPVHALGNAFFAQEVVGLYQCRQSATAQQAAAPHASSLEDLTYLD
jgi:hypothetical protein